MTVLCKVEDLINSRPLTYVSSEDTIVPLTPNHFLRLRDMEANEETIVDLSKISISAERLVEGIKVVKEVTATFRETFRSHYLLALRHVHEPTHYNLRSSVQYKPSPGAVVLIKEDSLIPRSRWPVGVIQQVGPRGSTAQVKVTQVKGDQVKHVIYDRPVAKLYPFEIPDQPTLKPQTAVETGIPKEPDTTTDLNSGAVNPVSPRLETGAADPAGIEVALETSPPPKKRLRKR